MGARRQPLRILVCPQEFKGSLTAAEAAHAIAAGTRAALPDAQVEELPLADGGPGTASIVTQAAVGTLVTRTVRGPLGEPVRASFGLLPGNPPRAVVEAAEAAGLVLVPAAERDPGRASSYGVGELLRAALEADAREVIVGVGGTGTNDGGAGLAQALGYTLLDTRGTRISAGPLELARLHRIEWGDVEPRLRDARVRVAVDVRNPLLGPQGATAVYGPQKGVTAELAPRLEAALARWAEVVARDLGVAIADVPGAGAGGGIAAGLLATCGASIESGAALVGEAAGLSAALARADLVVTGEGRLDAQTGYGKTVAYALERAGEAGVPCLVVAGSIEAVPPGVRDAEASAVAGEPVEVAMAHAVERVQAAAERVVRRYASG